MVTTNSARAAASFVYLWLHALMLSQPAIATPSPGLPMVINTWGGPFTAATEAAYTVLLDLGKSALDAVELGCATCERNQCDGSVGFGGSPDEACETTLDAMLMDGTTMKSGAVAGLRRVRDAVSVARRVLENTRHSLLVGDLATRFAVENGFWEEVLDGGDLSTPDSRARCEAWKRASCQPNYRINVTPDPSTSCGPYGPLLASPGILSQDAAMSSHDTISMVAIHSSGAMAAGTSTNGASHKVPGRVGDGPIVGSGSYVDGEVGGCGATGDGDIMMRFLPCYQAVENLRRGMSPKEAAEDAVRRMVRKYPSVASGIVVVDNKGDHGAAGSGWTFTYAFRGGDMNATEVVTVPPVEVLKDELLRDTQQTSESRLVR
ncbi:asparaginase-domain-containing protein [Podospora didyma]|uniref:Asparaginase-domain-containing protein n=1 Tax=Podospora didyma TaxID=330526 RepID=A0AAE0TZW3_9PEZI|nr:asparaginase-domain-containing protein [Podospora didyma]